LSLQRGGGSGRRDEVRTKKKKGKVQLGKTGGQRPAAQKTGGGGSSEHWDDTKQWGEGIESRGEEKKE